jgi:hypothetical protein
MISVLKKSIDKEKILRLIEQERLELVTYLDDPNIKDYIYLLRKVRDSKSPIRYPQSL